LKGYGIDVDDWAGLKIMTGYDSDTSKYISIKAVAETEASNATGMSFGTSQDSATHTEKMRLSANGELAIGGITEPGYALKVTGKGKFTSDVQIHPDGDSSRLKFKAADIDNRIIGLVADNLRFSVWDYHNSARPFSYNFNKGVGIMGEGETGYALTVTGKGKFTDTVTASDFILDGTAQASESETEYVGRIDTLENRIKALENQVAQKDAIIQDILTRLNDLENGTTD